MLLWSTHPFSIRKTIDESFIQILLLSCVREEKLRVGEVKDETMIFIEGIHLAISRHNFHSSLPCNNFVIFFSRSLPHSSQK